MSVDAGSISSSVRIKLDQLNQDIAACKTAFDQLGGNLAASAANYANITGKQYFAALKKIQTETDNITAAAKAGALTEQQATAKLIQLRQQELAILQKRAISEAGSNKATIAAIKETTAGLQKLVEKHNLLEKAAVPAGASMMNAFRNLQSVMQGPVAAAQAIISGIKSIAAEADRLIMSAQESEKSQALLASTIAATGASAWTSKSKLNDYANTVSKTTLFENEAVTSMQTVLLGFKNIQGVNFDKASTEIMNMATIMNMDLKSAAQAVGKALDDPIAGIDALSRQGFRFSEEQKKVLAVMVETGDIAGAQNIILKELSTTYGGAASAAADNAAGKYMNLKKSIGEVTEELGRALAASDQWGKLGGFVSDVAEGIGKLNQMNDLKVRIKEIQELMGTRGFMSSGVAEQNKQLAQFGLSVDDISSGIGVMKERIAELKKDNKPWSPIIANKEEIKRLEGQIRTSESLIPIIKEADNYNNQKAKKDKKNADDQAKADAEQVARIAALAEEKKKADEEEKAASAEKKRARQEELKAFSDAMEKSRERYKETEKQIQLLGKEEKEQQELKRKWDIEAIQRANISDEQKAAEIAKLNVLYEKQDELAQADANKKLAASAQDYQDKLDALNGVVKDQIAVERERAMKLIESAKAEGASAEEIERLKKIIEEYLGLLERSKGPEDFAKKLNGMSKGMGEVNKYFQAFLSAIDTAISESYDRQIEAAAELAEERTKLLEEEQEEQRKTIDAEYEHKLELLENEGLTREEFLKKKVADALAAGDAEAQADAEKELLIYQTQAEYAEKQKALEDKQAVDKLALENSIKKKSLKLEYDSAIASWRIDLASATAQGALAVMQAIASVKGNLAGMIAAGAGMGIVSGIQIGAVAAAKPKMPKLGTGGIILPQAGGVPTVQAENGYAELSLNGGPSGMALLDTFASRIALAIQRSGGNRQEIINYIGTVISSPDGLRELGRLLDKYGSVETARRG